MTISGRGSPTVCPRASTTPSGGPESRLGPLDLFSPEVVRGEWTSKRDGSWTTLNSLRS